MKLTADTITDAQIIAGRGAGIPLGVYVLALTPNSAAWIDGATMTTREARGRIAEIINARSHES